MRSLAFAVACLPLAFSPYACGGSAFTDASSDAGGADALAGGDGSPAADGSPGTDAAPHDGATTGDGSSADTSIDVVALDAPMQTITGKIVDPWLRPMANVPVHVRLSDTQTDATGTFTLPGVVPPYDAIVTTSGTGGHAHGYVFKALTRSDPTLQLVDDAAVPLESSTVSGTVACTGLITSGIVFLDLAAPAVLAGQDWGAISATQFSIAATWAGMSPASSTAYALMWSESSSHLPVAYSTIDSAAVDLAAGTAVGFSDTLAVSASSGTVTPTLTVSSGYELTGVEMYIRPEGAITAAPIVHDTSGSRTPTYVSPAVPGASLVVCGRQSPIGGSTNDGPFAGACVTGLGSTASPLIVLPQATTLASAPATGVTVATAFTWNGLTNGVHVAKFSSTTAAAPAFYVVTGDATAHIPDLSAYQLELPTATPYTVQITGVAPFATLDAAAGTGGFIQMALAFSYDVGPFANGQGASSGSSAFTTQ